MSIFTTFFNNKFSNRVTNGKVENDFESKWDNNFSCILYKHHSRHNVDNTKYGMLCLLAFRKYTFCVIFRENSLFHEPICETHSQRIKHP